MHLLSTETTAGLLRGSPRPKVSIALWPMQRQCKNTAKVLRLSELLELQKMSR